jgi:hypothetical protein
LLSKKQKRSFYPEKLQERLKKLQEPIVDPNSLDGITKRVEELTGKPLPSKTDYSKYIAEAELLEHDEEYQIKKLLEEATLMGDGMEGEEKPAEERRHKHSHHKHGHRRKHHKHYSSSSSSLSSSSYSSSSSSSSSSDDSPSAGGRRKDKQRSSQNKAQAIHRPPQAKVLSKMERDIYEEEKELKKVIGEKPTDPYDLVIFL